MSEYVRDDVVTTRKPHPCWGCTKVIPKGSKVTRVISVDMRKMLNTYWCDGCVDRQGEADDGDGIPYGVFRE